MGTSAIAADTRQPPSASRRRREQLQQLNPLNGSFDVRQSLFWLLLELDMDNGDYIPG